MATRCLWLTKGLGRGGVERLMLDMYPLVDRERFEVEVAYVLPNKTDYHVPLEERGALVHRLAETDGRPLAWIPALRSLLRSRGYGLVHSHAPVPAAAARLLGGGSSRPAFVHTEHNVWDRYRPPTRLINAATYGRNAQVIAVSDTVADSIRPWHFTAHPPVTTVLHGTVLDSVTAFDPDERSRRRRTFDIPEHAFVIGVVGNFTPKKDHASLLEALAGAGPIAEAHLVLVGLGPLEADLRSRCDALGIADRVTFLGSRDDVFEILPLFDLFCLSSVFEGFPISLVEAMATGLPCVATRVGGIPEILIDEQNGLLVQPGAPDQLRAAINRLIDDPELADRCAKEARLSGERLDLRQAVRTMESLYVESMAARQ